jgi:4-diphosphocytidyl-2-C-methyl-D-erythritol kinase
LGAEIAVDKRLPLGGGLGGGSSDAATTLLALNHLWGLDLPRSRLLELALELGADVPVFVRGENAWAEGVGERLRPLELPPAWYVVLTPPVVVSTARIFAHPELKRDSKTVRIQSFSAAGPNENDLEPVVCREHPEVARHLDWLRQFGRAMMTGSGASVFAGFESLGAAQAVFARLPRSMTGFVARGLERHPLRDLAR